MDTNFPHIYKKTFFALGTEIGLQFVVGNEVEKNKAQTDAVVVEGLYESYTKIFSRFDTESELSFLNAHLHQLHEVSAEMLKLAALSLDFHQKTEGLFDPRILEELEKNGYSQSFEKGIFPKVATIDSEEINQLEKDLKIEQGKICLSKRMDFSGIAKGFITDKVVAFLLQQGWKNFLLDSGGDMFACGTDEEHKKWTIDVEGINQQKILLHLTDQAIATSGIGKRKWENHGKRFHHLINPKNVEAFAFDLNAVTVIANTTTEADVLAKTLFLMGRERGILWAKEKAIAAIFLNYNGESWMLPEMKKYLNP